MLGGGFIEKEKENIEHIQDTFTKITVEKNCVENTSSLENRVLWQLSWK